MTDSTNNIGDVEARLDDHKREYQGAWHVHNGAINGIRDDASLRDLDARRSKALEFTEDAAAHQSEIADKMIETVEVGLESARAYLDAGDYSDGLDGLEKDALKRVLDRSIIAGKERRAVASALLLDGDGDVTALSFLRANFPDARRALDYLDDYGDDPNAVLAPLRSITVRLPDDERVAATREVAERHAREDRERRAAEELADLEERKVRIGAVSSLHARATNGRMVSDESRTRRRNAPYGH